MKKFSLIELLVVVAIISLLASFLLPVLGKARENSRSMVCLNNQKQVSVGTMHHLDDNDGVFPLDKDSDWMSEFELD